MSDDNRWTDKIDNEILEWVLYNSKNIETITPRMLIKIIDIKTYKNRSNLKYLNLIFINDFTV